MYKCPICNRDSKYYGWCEECREDNFNTSIPISHELILAEWAAERARERVRELEAEVERLKGFRVEHEQIGEVLDQVGIARVVGTSKGRKDMSLSDRVDQLENMWAFEREARIDWGKIAHQYDIEVGELKAEVELLNKKLEAVLLWSSLSTECRTWEQERAAIVQFIDAKINSMDTIDKIHVGDSFKRLIKGIEDAAHWPTEEKS